MQKASAIKVLGQSIGLPTMALHALIGVAVTSATTIIYKKTIWDPVDVLTRFNNPVILIVAMVALCIATLATNIAANVVSPANDFANLAPKYINFRMGGYITGIIGGADRRLEVDGRSVGLHLYRLIAYSALLGPIGGIMIVDYFVHRHCRLLICPPCIARTENISYLGGFSLVALTALVLGVLPSLPGFLVAIKVLNPEGLLPFLLGALSLRMVRGLRPGFCGLFDFAQARAQRLILYESTGHSAL